MLSLTLQTDMVYESDSHVCNYKYSYLMYNVAKSHLGAVIAVLDLVSAVLRLALASRLRRARIVCPTVEARKLEHHYPHALKLKHKGS